MRLRKNPGWVISSAAHAALLSAILFGFFHASEVVDPHEAVPVEMVDGRELDQILKGEKTAASVAPRPRAEKHADLAEPKPLPPVAEANKDLAAPVPPAKRLPDPGQSAAKEEPEPEPKPESKPVQKSTSAEPPAPVPEPPRPEPKPKQVKESAADRPRSTIKPPPPEDAETIEQKPVPKPKVAEQKPEPQKETKPAVVAKKPEPRFEPDRLAKLLEQEKQQEKQKPPVEKPTDKPAAKPKSGDETSASDKKFDPTDITKFLSKEAAQRKAAAGPELQQLAALGAPNASAAKMSPSLWDQLDGLLQEQYKRCWTFVGLGGQKKYIPEIRVRYAENGSLTAPPELVNPPSDPNLKALAESALRAVRRCDPLSIPARYQPYYEQWKGRIVRFDPEEML
jgi:colicin import membrane protein